MRRASALIMVLWIIAVLSVMVLSFAAEARLQAGINVYVRERNRTIRLVDAGQVLAEVVIAGFKDAPDWSEGENEAELLEDDRWYKEKRALKSDSKCVIGPILVDPEHTESGTVTVEIEMTNAGEKNAINVNELSAVGDSQNYRLRWEMILQNYCGIPEDYEVEVKDGSYGSNVRVKLVDLLIANWCDWRDEDDVVTNGEDGHACGAESAYYEEFYEDIKADDEDRRYPRNGAIPDVKELAYVRGWRDYPAVLTGGVLNPDDDKDEQITVKGIADLFGTTGSAKLNANSCTVEQLLTIPGIGPEDEDDAEESQERAQAIVAALKEPPERRDDYDETRDWWPYVDFGDLQQRVLDAADVEIGQEAAQYLEFKPDENTTFKVRIVGESMGMSREVNAVGYVKEKTVRYIEWRED